VKVTERVFKKSRFYIYIEPDENTFTA